MQKIHVTFIPAKDAEQAQDDLNRCIKMKKYLLPLLLVFPYVCVVSVANAGPAYKNSLFFGNRSGYIQDGITCLKGADAGKSFADSAVVTASGYFSISSTGPAAVGNGTVSLYPADGPKYDIGGSSRTTCEISIGAWSSAVSGVSAFTITDSTMCVGTAKVKCPDNPGTAASWFWLFSKTNDWTAGNFSVIPGSENATSIEPSFGIGYYRVATVKNCDTSTIATPFNVTRGACCQAVIIYPIDTTICNGDKYRYKGIDYTASTVIKDTIRSAFYNCDSIYVNVNLTVLPAPKAGPNVYIPVNYGDTYIYEGVEYGGGAVIKDTLRSVYGCDSIYFNVNITNVLFITGSPEYKNSLFFGNRSGYIQDGTTCLKGADAGKSFADSAVVTASGYFSISSTGPATVGNGTVSLYPADGPKYDIGGSTRIPCDISIGAWSAVSGVNAFMITDSNVCGGTVTVKCPDNPGTATSWFWLFSETNSWTAGNFSVVPGSENATSIEPSFGIGYYRVATVKNCDTSTIATPFNVTSLSYCCPAAIIYPDIDTTICYGNKYEYKGINYTASAVIKDTIHSTSHNCDSVYFNVNLTVLPAPRTGPDLNIPIGYGDTYTYKGVEYSKGAVIKDTLRSVYGCDSVYFNVKIAVNICSRIESDMVHVSGGTFTFGVIEGQVADMPARTVTLSDFYISKYEVTEYVWNNVMGNNPSFSRKGGDFPVESITWADANEFVRLLRDSNGCNFRIPTEIEWEYAARGGAAFNSHYRYSGSDNIDDVAWYSDNSGGTKHETGLKNANDLGLYDMSGNVFEWCHDAYGTYKYSGGGCDCVFRGGSYNDTSPKSRLLYRGGGSPNFRYKGIGLRLVRD